MIVAIPVERVSGEQRVAATPTSVDKLKALGFDVIVESGAGQKASFSDALYQDAGADIVSQTTELFAKADVVLKVNGPTSEEVSQFNPGTLLISFLWPAQNPELLQQLAAQKINVLAMDSVPRISRAQKMDALSTMANIGGYRAVVEAAHHFGRFLTGQITAAGKIPPAKVLVIGAGVAGLAAIGTAKSMGAIVRAFDTRVEVKDQVESMGGEFLTVEVEEDGAGTGGYAREMSRAFIEAEMALFREQAEEVDIVITTALIPGKPAPRLWQADAVQAMKEGSVVVDMAAEQGGNCELTEPGEVAVKEGVTIIGYTNLASRLPGQSSTLYAQNLVHLLTEMAPEKDGQPVIDMENEAIRGATVVNEGEITWPPPAPRLSASPTKPKSAAPVSPPKAKETKPTSPLAIAGFWVIAGLLLYGIGRYSPPSFLSHFMVFVLAIFIGWQVVWNVSHSLHTPLMSVTNAISGIIIVGALLQISSSSWLVTLLAFIAILLASINIVGGFMVTRRMLAMFRR